MDGTISPEEFYKLKMQVDILQKFLTKTFGSTFLDFCKEAQSKLTAHENSSLKTKGPSTSAGTPLNTKHGLERKDVKAEMQIVSSKPAIRRPPPPLLHRPAIVKPNTGVTILSGNTEISRVSNSFRADDAGVQEEYYVDGQEDDDVEILQPETVFSDEEANNSSIKRPHDSRKANGNNHNLKRNFSTAFEYDDQQEQEINQENISLPAGTDCIMLDSEDDQGQAEAELYEYQHEDTYEEGADMYDEEGFLYNNDVTEATGNYQTEDLQTDGNVTFGTLITAADTGIQYFQCAFCPSPKVFKHKQSLKEHYLLNHSPTPPAFQCQCGRRFLKQSQLKRHEVVHTAERPFVCPICGKDFTRKDNMTVHMVRNHAEKKHPCPYCPDKIYATPAEVNRHLRLYHSQWQQ